MEEFRTQDLRQRRTSTSSARHYAKGTDTGETILSGCGKAQMEVVTDKIKRKFNVEP